MINVVYLFCMFSGSHLHPHNFVFGATFRLDMRADCMTCRHSHMAVSSYVPLRPPSCFDIHPTGSRRDPRTMPEALCDNVTESVCV